MSMLCSFVDVQGDLYYCPLAEFSSAYATPRLEGALVVADPISGETPLRNAKAVAGKIVLMQRGTCDFVTKTIHAQKAGAIGLIVANTDEENPQLAFVMDAGLQRAALRSRIPAVMAPFETAQYLLDLLGDSDAMCMHIAIVLLNAAEASTVLDAQASEKRRQLAEAEALLKQQDRERQQREATLLLRSRLAKEASMTKFVSPEPSTTPALFCEAVPLPSAVAVAVGTPHLDTKCISPRAAPRFDTKPDGMTSLATGLLVLDMQYYCAMPHVGKFANQESLNAYYFDRLRKVVVPNVQRLLEAFRARNYDIIYGTIESATKTGRDRSKAHKIAGIHVPRGSFEAKVLDDVSPLEADVVVPRTAHFGTTNVDYLLRNLGVQCVVVTGVSTLGSLEAAVRGAMDRGYATIVLEDAIAFETSDEHDAVMRAMDRIGAGYMASTSEFVQSL
ncbi:hypothetical protein SPRG_07253 [Saprolegnia parasitica CBS 223.65]|uniref:Isochorismatase-like domain-containing protein n=1 Tax=Saprolegnia parasitica (strain CBS 223.65) TaxID=695850 RepID=A0A067CN49_SAPPC|nr:hypothetical protein SPRG_07253 [Saprolegnia parasitica CBS 223.65]KDO27976.1 hypothetical protein SPRG_07253 [Saprolegnia parasitica CBS 223.65]|eukprot:XP_012201425.1 hypothetical protein SPRG_07253 [Saprolegnia parasitica CBS 223.65]